MRVLAIFLTTGVLAGPALACGPDTDCMLGDRHYRIAMPEGQSTDPVGAVVFAHGYRGSAAAVMQNFRLIPSA